MCGGLGSGAWYKNADNLLDEVPLIFGPFIVLNSRIRGHPVTHLKAVLLLELDHYDNTRKDTLLYNRNKPVNFLPALREFLKQ